MPVEIQTQSVHPGHQASFQFSANVVSHVVGVSYWSFTYDKGDHQTKTIQLSVASNVDASNTSIVHATPSAVLSGEGHNISTNASEVNLVCIAVTKQVDRQLTLASQLGISDLSAPIATPYPNQSCQAFVTGFSMSYGGGHHVKTFEVSATPQGVAGNQQETQIAVQAVMEDNSNHHAQDPTVDAGLFCFTADETGLVVPNQQPPRLQTTGTHDVDLPEAVSKAAVLITDMKIEYPKHDHDIATIGGGVLSWTLVNDNKTVRLSQPMAFMRDADLATKDHDQDNDESYVSLVVVATP